MEVLNKQVLVVGLGKSGLAAARWLSKAGAEVTIGDVKKEEEIDQDILKECRVMGVKLEIGEHRIETFINSELIVVSPGVPLNIAPLIASKKKGVPIIGEIELALRIMNTPMIAVTGTNGKTTTVSLLGNILEKAGLNVFVGGNIGTPLIELASGDLDADYAVIEISSFQLDTIDLFCPEISIILNISPDHLDRYEEYGDYVRSKLRIFRDQLEGQFVILNDDDERLSITKPKGPMSVLRYGCERRPGRHAHIQEKRIAAHIPGGEGYYFDTERYRLPGRHNIENLMAVILAGLSLDITPDVIQKSIDDFKGLPHRMELVGSINGIDFIDDSKATNVDAASRSIVSFDRPVILIGGGRHKWGDFLPLVKASKGKVKKAILLGEAKELMAQSFKGIIPFSFAEGMEDAVAQAFSSAQPGDIVLLAPACSSFDMFSDYAHRGRIFREAVERL